MHFFEGLEGVRPPEEIILTVLFSLGEPQSSRFVLPSPEEGFFLVLILSYCPSRSDFPILPLFPLAH